MALHQRAFDILVSLAPCRLLSLGVPDLLLNTKYDLPEIPRADLFRQLHQWTNPIYQTDLVFKHHGIEATYLDVKQHTGVEIVADLNRPMSINGTDHIVNLPGYLPGRAVYSFSDFDVVLDPGTLEHCFNIGQAFCNVRNLCKPGGHIIHHNPMNIVNHGFYSISPTAYGDFYQHHKDEMLNVTALTNDGKENFAVQLRRRFNFPIPAWTLIVVKRSAEPTLSRGWPAQFKYLNPEEKEERKGSVR